MYWTDVINPVELTVPTLRVVLEEIPKDLDDKHAEGRMVDLEGLEEKCEVARRRSQRYQ